MSSVSDLVKQIPPDVVSLALRGAEALARAIADKLGLDDEVEKAEEIVEKIKNAMLESAFTEGVALGLAISDLASGAQSVLRAMEDAEKSRVVPPLDIELIEIKEDK